MLSNSLSSKAQRTIYRIFAYATIVMVMEMIGKILVVDSVSKECFIRAKNNGASKMPKIIVIIARILLFGFLSALLLVLGILYDVSPIAKGAAIVQAIRVDTRLVPHFVCFLLNG